MTDDQPRDEQRATGQGAEPEDRAEAAFRTALAGAAAHFDSASLDPAAVAARSRPRSWWRTGLVAAAVLVLVGASAYGVARLGDGSTSERQTADGPIVGALPDPDSGWRYVSYRDVVVQVPESWGYADAPGPDWCAFDEEPGKPPFPTEPYVATPEAGRFFFGIGCPDTDTSAPGSHDFESVPRKYWAPHLTLDSNRNPDLPPGVLNADLGQSWTLTESHLGRVRISLLTDADTTPLVDRILASARQVESDHNGCEATSPAQAEPFVRPDPAFDVSSLESVGTISVCLYERIGTNRPGLTGSRQLTGSAADQELAAIQAAPAGGGPDHPNNCVDDEFGDSAVVLRLHDGDATYDMHVYYETCFGNGFDDGTTLRELTRDACRPLWGDAVQVWSGSSAPFERCHG